MNMLETNSDFFSISGMILSSYRMLVRFPNIVLMMLCPLLDSPRRETISQQPIPEREGNIQEKKLSLYSQV